MTRSLTLNIGLCGFGTVGQGVWKHLSSHRAELEARLGVTLNLARASVRDRKKKRAVKIPARALTDECLARARADRAPVIGLHTAEMMTAARTLYEAAGFVHHEDFTHLDIGFSIFTLRM